MTHHLTEYPLIKRYLLGGLNEQEQKQMERRYFKDDDYLALLLAAEEDLIESYKSRTLSEADRTRFEKYYLSSPRRRLRAELFSVIKKIPSPPPAPPEPEPEVIEQEPVLKVWRRRLRGLFERRALQAATAALVLAAAACLWLSYRRGQVVSTEVTSGNRATPAGESVQPPPSPPPAPPGVELGHEIVRAPAAVEGGARQHHDRRRPTTTERRNAVPPDAPGRIPETGAPTLIASLTVIPNSFRTTAEPDTLLMHPSNNVVRLNLFVDDQEGRIFYATFWPNNNRAAAQTRNALKPQATPNGRIVSFEVPAQHLSDGTYILILQAVKEDGSKTDPEEYSFKIERQ